MFQKLCPFCGRMWPPNVAKCECGYEFSTEFIADGALAADREPAVTPASCLKFVLGGLLVIGGCSATLMWFLFAFGVGMSCDPGRGPGALGFYSKYLPYWLFFAIVSVLAIGLGVGLCSNRKAGIRAGAVWALLLLLEVGYEFIVF
jgi:hypothetical protein